jgi:hypothetical protein
VRGRDDGPGRSLGNWQRAAGWLVLLSAIVCVLGACGGGDAPSSPVVAAKPPSTAASPRTSGRHHRRTAAHRRQHRRHARHLPAVRRRPAVPAVDMPTRALTPGAALAVGRARICRSGYASAARDVPESEKDEVYVRYGVAHVPYQHEVDHLVSLELGGSNAISNLWPEPYAGRWGARTKDVLENRLHDLVCSGAIGLRYAQRIEAYNWVAAYRRFVGAAPFATAPAVGSSGGGSAGGGGGGKCTPGYAPCLSDKDGEDYDCYGGGGNGPLFTRPGVTYTVTGDDPYGLDGNHDGRACG